MPYLAKKVCKFGGRNYLIGETIPDEVVDPKRVKGLIEEGRIVPTAEIISAPAKEVIVEEIALESMTKKELIECAKQFDIELDEKMKKEDMVSILNAALPSEKQD